MAIVLLRYGPIALAQLRIIVALGFRDCFGGEEIPYDLDQDCSIN